MSQVINQGFHCEELSPAMMDRLWAAGWRHFGPTFFRYNYHLDAETGAVLHITPLRVDLEHSTLTKSQRRVLRKNADLRCDFVPATIFPEAEAMFARHKGRFKSNVPETLDTFLAPMPDTGSRPCVCMMCRVFLGEDLVALSYLDVGEEATSAVYGMFEPVHGWRSLGVYTMLQEMAYARATGRRLYYPGYATREPSPYDYKKQLRALEMLDWATGHWQPQEAAETAEAAGPDEPA